MTNARTDKVMGKYFFLQSQSDDDSGNDSDTSDNPGKRKRFDEDAIEKRIVKRKWEEQRYSLCGLMQWFIV